MIIGKILKKILGLFFSHTVKAFKGKHFITGLKKFYKNNI